MAMRSLAPQVKAIQERYAGDQVKFCSFSSCVCVCFIWSKEFLMFFLLHWLLLHTLQRKKFLKKFLNSVLFLSY